MVQVNWKCAVLQVEVLQALGVVPGTRAAASI